MVEPRTTETGLGRTGNAGAFAHGLAFHLLRPATVCQQSIKIGGEKAEYGTVRHDCVPPLSERGEPQNCNHTVTIPSTGSDATVICDGSYVVKRLTFDGQQELPSNAGKPPTTCRAVTVIVSSTHTSNRPEWPMWYPVNTNGACYDTRPKIHGESRASPTLDQPDRRSSVATCPTAGCDPGHSTHPAPGQSADRGTPGGDPRVPAQQRRLTCDACLRTGRGHWRACSYCMGRGEI